MPRADFAELSAFVLIATHRSFRKAADELALSPSTLSHMMRTLERNMGVRLLHRTTRSVSPTEAGERLLARVQPLLRELDHALLEVDEYRVRPSGTLRINTSDSAARLLLRDVVPTFLERYPEMTLDLVSENKLVDIVALGFDAGIRLGEFLQEDMVAVRFGGPFRFVLVASRGYLAEHPAPRTPDELLAHRCVRIRMPSGNLYRWELEQAGEERVLEVTGALILDNVDLMVEAAANGLGIAYVPESAARRQLDEGRLVTVLDEWCPHIPGLFLYYPGHRHVPPGLRAFIEVLRERMPA